MKTLVIGLGGTGKTTYCKNNLGRDGLCYDLDAVAAAFRLREPHEENNKQAAMLANDLLFAFFTHVNQYTSNVYIIRAAPTIEEFKRIAPQRVVICKERFIKRNLTGTNETDMLKRIADIESYCMRYNIETVVPKIERVVELPKFALKKSPPC